MNLSDIITGRIDRPKKILIYGVEGIGKSTLASQFPDPLFVDCENRTSHLDIQRVMPATWGDVIEIASALARDDHKYRTVVIDTADWAEAMAARHVCNEKCKEGIEDFGYGKGHAYVREAVGDLLKRLDDLQRGRYMHIVLCAHAQIKRFDDPQHGLSYDRYSLKCNDKVSSMLREWVDAVLFCNYQVVTKTTNNVTHAMDGRNRTIFTNHTAAFDAKNSWGMPEEVPMKYEEIARYIETVQPDAKKQTRDPEREASSKRYWNTCLELASTVGGKAFVVDLLKQSKQSFSTMTVGEMQMFIDDVRNKVNDVRNNVDAANSNERAEPCTIF